MVTPGEGLTPVRTAEALGRVIRRRREHQGWTQQDLAAHVVATRHLIIDIESGHQTRAIRALLDTLAALDLELVVRDRQ